MAIHDRAWSERPTDVANLLNPAFVGATIRSAVVTYEQAKDKGMPFEFVFLVLPIVLHEPTRARLPRSSKTMMQTWLQENRDVLMGFPTRAKDLVPFGREAILFASRRELLVVGSGGHVSSGKRTLAGVAKYVKDRQEVSEIFKKAALVGSWLASAGAPTTVFAMLGIRP